jgi:NO-binding membrane sensor protein with MHYT domain
VIASCFALVSFAAAVVVGMAAGNPAHTIIWRATLIMLACWFVGYGIGTIALHAVNRRLEAYKQAHPLPTIESLDQSDEVESQQQDGGDPSAAATSGATA